MNRYDDQLFGISAALVTPFNEDLTIDNQRLAEHAGSVLARGCSRVTLFGTCGEGASITDQERTSAHQALLDSGIEASQIVVCICSAAQETAKAQAMAALETGCYALLVPPPFYFKGVSDAGLYQWYSGFISHISEFQPQIIMYHIPQVTGVGLSLNLIRRLKDTHAKNVLGVKDSGGHWPTTRSFLSQRDLAVLVGDERYLAIATRAGGAGSISGMANFLPEQLVNIFHSGEDNVQLNRLVSAVTQFPATAAVKVLTGNDRSETGWERVRSPLVETPMPARQRLLGLLKPRQSSTDRSVIQRMQNRHRALQHIA